jgi:hypothetical protein
VTGVFGMTQETTLQRIRHYSLNHDWKDYKIALIRVARFKAVHHGNQVNQENHG